MMVAAAIDWARARGLHKLTLSVFPHNDAAIALYRKFGFVEEGRRSKQIRRANGELWDLIEDGAAPLSPGRPGARAAKVLETGA